MAVEDTTTTPKNIITEAFTSFQNAKDLKEIVSSFDSFLHSCNVSDDVHGLQRYHLIKASLLGSGWYLPTTLFKLLDAKVTSDIYHSPKKNEAKEINAVIIGAGIAGLRTAIEFSFLGATITVCEKRESFSRNNVLHIWPSTTEDLKNIGVKFFYPKFCVGSILHCSIRQLQCALLKIALIMGVQIRYNTEFSQLSEPSTPQSSMWQVQTKSSMLSYPRKQQAGDKDESSDDEDGKPSPKYQLAQEYATIPCNVLVGADGENSVVGQALNLERKVFQGARAIGVTCNFVNTNTPEEGSLKEFGVMSIYDQAFFSKLAEQGIDLENLVYFRDETHYFVMTPKKESLLKRKVLKENLPTNAELLSRSNIDMDALRDYVRDIASDCGLPIDHPFASSASGAEDIGIFDFSRKTSSALPLLISSPKNDIFEATPNNKLLALLVGDALVEPFWPLGTGANRGVQSSLDAAWSVKGFKEGKDHQIIAKEAEIAYEALLSSSPESLKSTTKSAHTMDPQSRYTLRKMMVSPVGSAAQ